MTKDPYERNRHRGYIASLMLHIAGYLSRPEVRRGSPLFPLWLMSFSFEAFQWGAMLAALSLWDRGFINGDSVSLVKVSLNFLRHLLVESITETQMVETPDRSPAKDFGILMGLMVMQPTLTVLLHPPRAPLEYLLVVSGSFQLGRHYLPKLVHFNILAPTSLILVQVILGTLLPLLLTKLMLPRPSEYTAVLYGGQIYSGDTVQLERSLPHWNEGSGHCLSPHKAQQPASILGPAPALSTEGVAASSANARGDLWATRLKGRLRRSPLGSALLLPLLSPYMEPVPASPQHRTQKLE